MRAIDNNLQAVLQRIAQAARAAGREPAQVTLLAVSKTHPAARLQEAFDAGQRAFGENYVQEALEKMDALAERKGIAWHLVGPLQSNKTRLAAARFDWVHTVESEKIARRLSGQRSGNLAPLNVLIQVNVSGEPTKSGVAPGDVEPLALAIAKLPRLKLRGIMAIPEPGAERARFDEVKAVFDRLRNKFQLDTLSMGMSDDLETAIAAGSTLVRIGTAIFGARQKEMNAA